MQQLYIFDVQNLRSFSVCIHSGNQHQSHDSGPFHHPQNYLVPFTIPSCLPRKPLIYIFFFTIGLFAFLRILYNWNHKVFIPYFWSIFFHNVIIFRIIHAVCINSSFLFLLSSALLSESTAIFYAFFLN